MKAVKLILASVMIAGAAGTYAQDSTMISIPIPPQDQDQTTPPVQVQQDQMNFKRNMVIIQPSDVPASLRTTLQGSQYKGWERGVIYRNQTSDMFMVEMRDGNQSRLYRFDQNGKPVKDY
jgi:hypothetical protein